jgi:hypothetical protein
MRASISTVQDLDDVLVIADVGDWTRQPTVTNDVESVVEWLYAQGMIDSSKKLLCYDSEGQCDEILHENGQFRGFAPTAFRRY